MKKVLLFVLSLVLLFTLASCQSDNVTMRKPTYDTPVFIPNGLDFNDEVKQRYQTLCVLETFHRYGEILPEFSSTDECYAPIITACIFKTEPLGEKADDVPSSRGVSKEHLQKTVNTFFSGNIKVDGERYEKEGDTKWAYYDKELDLFFVMPSYFEPNIPIIISYQNNTAEVVFAHDSYGSILTLDGKVITKYNGEGEKYDGTLENYVLNDATRYLVEFDSKGRIKSFKKK
jgi:hypothetical protein